MASSKPPNFMGLAESSGYFRGGFVHCGQWRSQEFRLGGARLKENIGNKKLININNKISKQLYDNIIVKQNLK